MRQLVRGCRWIILNSIHNGASYVLRSIFICIAFRSTHDDEWKKDRVGSFHAFTPQTNPILQETAAGTLGCFPSQLLLRRRERRLLLELTSVSPWARYGKILYLTASLLPLLGHIHDNTFLVGSLKCSRGMNAISDEILEVACVSQKLWQKQKLRHSFSFVLYWAPSCVYLPRASQSYLVSSKQQLQMLRCLGRTHTSTNFYAS